MPINENCYGEWTETIIFWLIISTSISQLVFACVQKTQAKTEWQEHKHTANTMSPSPSVTSFCGNIYKSSSLWHRHKTVRLNCAAKPKRLQSAHKLHYLSTHRLAQHERVSSLTAHLIRTGAETRLSWQSVNSQQDKQLAIVKRKTGKLEGHSVECMYLRQRCFHGSWWIKPCLATAMGGPYIYLGFSRRNKIQRCSIYTILEKAIWFRHPEYDLDWAQKLFANVPTDTCRQATFHPNPCTRFLSNLANRQTEKQTRAKTCTSSFVGGKNTYKRPCLNQQVPVHL